MHHVHSSRFTATEIQPAAGQPERFPLELRSIAPRLDSSRRPRWGTWARLGPFPLPHSLAPYPTADRDRGDDPAYDDNGPENRLEQPEPALDFRDPD